MSFLTHTFGHENSWAKFKKEDGSPLRPFTSTEEMNETMVERWNAVVTPQDTVYHLGDVVINKRYLDVVRRLNGKKRLIRGNHDIFKDEQYREVGFQKIYGVRVFVDRYIFSHIPLHPDCVTERFRVNVHGHLHANNVMWKTIKSNKDGVIYSSVEEDPRYHCVCVEQTDFRPVSFDELDARIEKQWELANYTPPKNAGWGNGSGPG